MEWRCEWCGKPHAEEEPPCDNCGHGSFERAVVRRTDLGDEGDPDTTTVWVCTACGREHTKHSPPCSRCTNADLERQQKRVDESNLTDRPDSGGGVGTVEAEETTVWVCAACGREHPKHAPPCSRCGHTTLARERKGVAENEITVPTYRELVTPGYLAALGLVLALAALFALGAAGVVDLPGFSGDSVPDIDAPGEGTAAGELSLHEVETAYLDVLGDRRAEAGVGQLERADRLDEVARFTNQRSVLDALGEGEPVTESELRDLVADECNGVRVVSHALVTDGTDAAALGRAFADAVERGPVLLGSIETTGVDVHSVDNRLFLTQIVCT